ncbi:MAG: RidA family protein [Verrucomicrobiota bacterium]|jgi:enamine deaminase RidA (YjgF/YER057c/UK114 family)
MSAEANITKLNLTLPPAPAPAGVYKPVVLQGSLAYVSGQGPVTQDGSLLTGRVGADVDKEQGKLAARQVGLTMLSTLKSQIGSLDRIARVIKLLGMVNSTPDFGEHPYVINGCSELFAEVFGSDNGIGARSAVGMGSLPGNITVEIEAIFELKPE